MISSLVGQEEIKRFGPTHPALIEKPSTLQWFGLLALTPLGGGTLSPDAMTRAIDVADTPYKLTDRARTIRKFDRAIRRAYSSSEAAT